MRKKSLQSLRRATVRLNSSRLCDRGGSGQSWYMQSRKVLGTKCHHDYKQYIGMSFKDTLPKHVSAGQESLLNLRLNLSLTG